MLEPAQEIKKMTDLQLWHSVNQFYYREARYLDDLDFTSWLGLLDDEINYWMPIVSNRTGRDVGKERTQPGELAHFEEDKTSLANRVKRLASGMAWAETPPGRTRHMISNVEILKDDGERAETRSCFIIWRSHLETDQEIFSGLRIDTLRRDAQTQWKVLNREIRLDHAVLTQKSLGIFF